MKPDETDETEAKEDWSTISKQGARVEEDGMVVDLRAAAAAPATAAAL